MPSTGLCVVWRADAPSQSNTIERCLQRLRPEVKHQVRALAAQKWLHSHDLPETAGRVQVHAATFGDAVWRALWRPFWVEKLRIPDWLPLAPSEKVLGAF